tara:strand:+ start:108 stop:308 length:201 start_codon:yes stop_codon:yes gene_type:complete
MTDSTLEEVLINFSNRQITLISDEGEVKNVNWKWDKEGTEGFSDTVSVIGKMLDPDMITYCFSTHD